MCSAIVVALGVAIVAVSIGPVVVIGYLAWQLTRDAKDDGTE